jgi:hypothetical protein
MQVKSATYLAPQKRSETFDRNSDRRREAVFLLVPHRLLRIVRALA